MANTFDNFKWLAETISPPEPRLGELDFIKRCELDYFQVTLEAMTIPLKRWYYYERAYHMDGIDRKHTKLPFMLDTWIDLWIKKEDLKLRARVDHYTSVVHFYKET